MKKSFVLIAALIPNLAFAADLPQYQVGPFNFDKAPVTQVLNKIFLGTGIQVEANGVPSVDVTTKGLSGPLNKVVERITSGSDLTYKFDGKTIFVNGRLVNKVATPMPDNTVFELGSKPTVEPVAEAPTPVFELKVEDKDIESAMKRWADEAKWNLIWEVPVKFPIETGTRFKGTFEQAVASVVDALRESDTPIRAKFYVGNSVLRIIENNGDK